MAKLSICYIMMTMERYIQYTVFSTGMNTMQLKVLLKLYVQYLESVVIVVCC